MAKLVVVVPCLDEAETISDILERIKTSGPDHIVVVDDGSKDQTAKLAIQAGAVVVSHRHPRGVGAAFKSGLDKALELGADIIVNIDGDGQMYPEDIPRLIKPIELGKADMVIANRFYYKHLPFKMPFVKRIGNKLFTKLTNFITKQHFGDSQCGFRAYSRMAAAKLNLFGKFTYTQESIIDAVEKGLDVVEMPLFVKAERKGRSRVVKSVFSYGFQALNIIYRVYRNNKPMKFFGIPGLMLFLLGFAGELFVIYDRLVSEVSFSQHIVLILISVFFNLIGFQVIVFAMIAEMNVYKLKTQEDTLWRIKYLSVLPAKTKL